MPETWSPLTWHNDQSPALNETNLNRIEVGVEVLDDRIATLENGIVTPVVVPFSTSVTLNATQGSLFRCVASADLTLDQIVGGTDGQTIVFEVQASGAQRTLHFTGSTATVDIANGQWWVGVFRYLAAPYNTWVRADDAAAVGGGNDLNVLAPQNLSYAATVTPNAATGALFRITAPGDFTLNDPINGTDGQAIVLEVLASGGARTVSFAAGYASITIPASTRWTSTLRYNSTTNSWLLATASNTASAVASVNGFTGAVALTADNVPDGSTKVTMTAAERTKLSGVATGATAYTDELVDDRVAALIVAGANITKTYDDTAGTLTIAASGGTGYATVQDEGTARTARGTLNFVGAGVTVTDDSAGSRTLVTIPGGGSGGAGYTLITPSGGNDVSQINTALGSADVLLVGSFTVSGSTISVPTGRTLDLGSATLTQTSTGGHSIITVGANATVRNGSIVGNQPGGATGFAVSLNGAGARAEGVRMTTCVRGVNINSGVTDYFVRGCRITNMTGQAINADIGANRGIISNNHTNTTLHGVQWWGGDSALSSTIGITDLVISNNSVHNVTGGIWGSLGARITVTGNEVRTCSDVGIDFEGCKNSVASGNLVIDCTNGCLATFYQSSDILFEANMVVNENVTGAAGYQAYGTGAATRISLIGNTFLIASAHAIYTVQSALDDFRIIGNQIKVTSGTSYGISTLDCNKGLVQGNTIDTGSASNGIRNEGGSDWVISNNVIRNSGTDPASVGSSNGGVMLYWRSSTYPAQRNRVSDNLITGYTNGIREDNWGSVTSNTLIQNNSVATVYRSQSGAGYQGFVTGNRVPTNPSTASTVT